MLAQVAQDSGDTAWVLVCTALVLFMVPGLALFYAGMVRSRNALTMLQQNIVPLGVVSILWALVGYSIAFSTSLGGLLGDMELFGLGGLHEPPAPPFHVVAAGVTIPTLAFVAYQMMFAIITPALITGATAGRLKALGWIVFVGFWSVIVYAPVAHWLWGPGGWLSNRGAQDWAGGMVVHASAGAAVLAMLVVIGRRRNYPKGARPHSIPLTIVGAGILWFGWFGFNAGDGLQANGVAAQALINTHLAAAAGLVVWLIVERLVDGHATVLGSVTGAVAGLATITPCAGYVSSYAAMIIGAVAGVVCHLALRLKSVFKFDDALDVVAVHFVGGALGTLLLGFFGERGVNSAGNNGLFHGGGLTLLGNQALALVSVVAYSFVLTLAIAFVIAKTIGLRVDPQDEARLDQVQQGTEAYHLDHLSNQPGPTKARIPAALPAEVRPVPANMRLVNTLVDPNHVDTDQMAKDLLAAGAASIVFSEAYLFDGGGSETVRGERRQVDFPDRLRVEVFVEPGKLDDALRQLNRFSSGRGDEYTQVDQPDSVTRG